MEVKIASIINSGVLNRASKRIVLQKVRSEIRNMKFLNDAERNQLWVFMTSHYRHCIAGAGRETDLPKRADQIYSVLRKDNLTLEHLKNDLANSVEYRRKHNELVEMLTNDDEKFYLCTVLRDCATDHQAYQGRIYYKEGASYSDEELKYISNHKLLSINEVIVKPPYLTTRRNCRHRFVPVSFLSVKTGVSEREYSFHEISYEEGQYHLYRDRYKMMQNIKKMFADNGVESKQLKLDMKKTQKLVISWYRASKKGK